MQATTIVRGRKALAYADGQWHIDITGIPTLSTDDPGTAVLWWRSSEEPLSDAQADVSEVWAASIQ